MIEDERRTYEVKEYGWSDVRASEWFEVRCVETDEVVYETDEEWKADLMCDRYNREGPP